MKIVIAGGSGWIGREAESTLQRTKPHQLAEILFYGSYHRELNINSRKYQVLKWDDHVQDSGVSLFLPLAFLTRDKANTLGIKKYNDVNRQLIARSEKYIITNKPNKVILISSGIVESNLQLLQRDPSFQIYADLKREEELRLQIACEKAGTNLVICRLFAASGEHMREPEKYAFGNLILQAMGGLSPVVKSKYMIFRKYVDMSQLLELCFCIVENTKFKILSSGGELIEIHELADIITDMFSLKKMDYEIDFTKEDQYYTKSSEMERLADYYGIRLLSISQQITKTQAGIARSQEVRNVENV